MHYCSTGCLAQLCDMDHIVMKRLGLLRACQLDLVLDCAVLLEDGVERVPARKSFSTLYYTIA